MRLSWTLWMLAACGLLAGAAVRAQSASHRVAFTGSMGKQALLVIDGRAPRALAVGQAVSGVKLVSLDGADAMVEIDGQRHLLRLGAAAVNLGGSASPGGGSTITLQADGRGHFMAHGQINGRSASFMVDTGATAVAMGQDDADRLGVDYKKGQRIGVQTANGVIYAWRTALTSVRIGDVEVHNVEAAVQPQAMPFILLGNTFLTRFQMRRDNDVLTLQRRF